MFIGTNMRTNTVTVVVGGRGTGKTTFLKGDEALNVKGVVSEYLKKNPDQKILIVDAFLSETWEGIEEVKINQLARWRRGVKRIIIDPSDTEPIVSAIVKFCYNTVVIFEDATRYCGSKLEKWFLRVPADSKQKNIDCFFVFHALMQVPPDLIRLSDFIILFKTNEEITSTIRNKYPFPELHNKFNIVKASKNRYYNEIIRIS